MKKTLVKSILLAIFGMMVVQNVNAQKISAGEEVATNIGPGLKVNDYFYYDYILYQVATVVADGNYEAKAVSFYGESLPAEIEIIGGGQANSCTFTVTEIKALNSVKTMSGTSYVAGDASALDAITTLIFVKEDGFGGFAGTIGAEAFGNLDNLEYIYSELTTAPVADDSSFDNIAYEQIILTLPSSDNGTVAGKYVSSMGWRWFTPKNVKIAGCAYGYGDVNMDGYTNVFDAADLREAKVGSYLDEMNDQSLDINGDTYVNVFDATALRIWVNQDFE